jgi:hypothetical protein
VIWPFSKPPCALPLAAIDHNSRDADLRTYRTLRRAAMARAVW